MMMSKSLALFVLIALAAWQIPAHSQSLALQERCAAEASNTFRQLQSENDAKYDPATLIQKAVGNFQSHYNSKLNRCLLLISRVAVIPLSTNLSNQQRQSFLVDANERRYYASYVETQLALETKPKVERCELRPTMRYRTVCTSRDEFDAFVATYLEE
jgi:ABC-type transporter MlaC component